MRPNTFVAICGLTAMLGAGACERRDAAPSSPPPSSAPPSSPAAADTAKADDAGDAVIGTLVGRLELEKYKALIKGLTQFGDRRQGTDRNLAAVNWIEAQLKSVGCTTTARLKYTYEPAPPAAPAPSQPSPNPQ